MNNLQKLKSYKDVDEFNKMFKDLNIKKHEQKSEQIEFILLKIYNLLRLKDAELKASLKDNTLKHTTIDLSVQKVWPTVLNDSWMDGDIKNYIKNKSRHCIRYDFKTKKRNISIYNMVFDGNIQNNLESIKKDIYLILLWLTFAEEYADDKYAKELDIYIYKTPYKKQMPSNPYMTIGTKHLNTGVTTSYKSNAEIVIWRDEEWFKVLIHECIHAFGLDFADVSQKAITKQVKRIFPINSEINLFEGYTETWAKILNCIMTSFILSKTDEVYLQLLDMLLKIERQYILFQMVKILDHMKLTYEDLYSKDPVCAQRRISFYKEDTNFFSYFVVSTILMNNYESFIEWCYTNNSKFIRFDNSTRNISKFIKYIEREYKNKNILERVGIFEQVNNMINVKNDMYNSTRFTIIELQ